MRLMPVCLRSLSVVALLTVGLPVIPEDALAQSPAVTARKQVSTRALVGSVEFEGLGVAERQAVLSILSIRVGGVLSVDARQLAAREIAQAGERIGKPLTFRYNLAVNGSVRFIVSQDAEDRGRLPMRGKPGKAWLIL